MTPAMIHLDRVEKSYGDHQVLKGVSLDVPRSSVVVLIGPSGSGKSTLLRCCNGLETAQQGNITINGQPLLRDGKLIAEKSLNALRTNVGMVFQSFNLFPHLSVLDNITIAPKTLKNTPDADARILALSLLEKVGLKD